jgi:tetratricopeptide (TPR) repeat protein
MRRVCLLGITLLAIVLIPGFAIACLWTYHTNIYGRSVVFDDPGDEDYLLDAFRNRRQHTSRLNLLKSRFERHAATAGYQDRNDYVVVLMSLGEPGKAIEILQSIEAERPNQYVTAVNLGTAYELQGDLKRALDWIKIGIERNPDAHLGSEWLHVKILEAEIALKSDTAWLESHSILGLDFGDDDVPVFPTTSVTGNTGQELEWGEVESAVEYQLHERISLIAPPNAVVADLLADLANLRALNQSFELAIPIYDLALDYQPSHRDLVEQRLERAREIVKANPLSLQPAPDPGYSFVVAASVIGVSVAIASVVGALALGWYLSRRRLQRSAEGK